jgi:predicted DNA-binding transcriptional regulator AlpA
MNNSNNSTVYEKLISFDHALDANEVAALLGLKLHTLYNFVRLGKVPHFHIGTCLRFDPGTLATWIVQQ